MYQSKLHLPVLDDAIDVVRLHQSHLRSLKLDFDVLYDGMSRHHICTRLSLPSSDDVAAKLVFLHDA